MNGHIYNQSLVKRDEILLGFDVIDNWDTELKEMHQCKMGQPFHYPNIFLLLLLGYAKAYFHLPYGKTEGITQAHAKGKVSSIPIYTINRRINSLGIKVENDNKSKESEDEYLIIAIDSTRIKVTNRGRWMQDKWKIRKKEYLKIHVTVNAKTKKILSMKVIDEHVHDNKTLPDLVENILKSDNMVSIGKLLGDCAYNGNDIFRYLGDNGILPCIKVRKNSRVGWKKGKNFLRNLSVLKQKNNLQKWKDNVSYGQRWIVETVFSAIKRTFGEYVYSVRLKNMVQEMMLKASLYNKMISV